MARYGVSGLYQTIMSISLSNTCFILIPSSSSYWLRIKQANFSCCFDFILYIYLTRKWKFLTVFCGQHRVYLLLCPENKTVYFKLAFTLESLQDSIQQILLGLHFVHIKAICYFTWNSKSIKYI